MTAAGGDGMAGLLLVQRGDTDSEECKHTQTSFEMGTEDILLVLTTSKTSLRVKTWFYG